MEVVAIIPARINTKRVPNKLLRIIGKHPLIYYTIRNAQLSKYITRIIVSTDSDKIAIIAKQMDVECIMRDPAICNDDVALDIVVYEAVKNINCDYVVTLQPTSPLLKVKTLDQAIEKCVRNQKDAMISVINKPHLAWERNELGIIPQYRQRLNSQFLPPYYIETGAFFISKKSVITKDSRLGQVNDIYEISKEEAISVCEMPDLALVNMMLNTKKVAFFVNGNNTRGMGHIYRVLELADEFYIKPDIYFDINQTDIASFGDTYYQLIGINGWDEFYEKLRENDYDVLINDILSTDPEYMKGVRECNRNMKVINFEDEGKGAAYADLVINALLSEVHGAKYCCGEQYYIVPKTFLYYEPVKIQKNVKRVLISFGGADPSGYTLKLIRLIQENKNFYSNYEFVVVVGRANKDKDEILKYNQFENFSVYYDVDNMPDIMVRCDIAVTSRGRTGLELAVLGIPAISIAQNSQEETHDFMSEKNGFLYLGYCPKDDVLISAFNRLLESHMEERKDMQNKMLKSDLRGGRDRVMHLIKSV